jgi:hypothetical protein
MSFIPNLFLSNIKAKEGLAKTSRFQVILPIPTYINNFIGQSIFDRILNLPNTIVADITDIFSFSPQDEQSRTSNPSLSRYLALQCESAELPGKSLITADAKVYGPGFKVPYQTQYQETTLNFICTNDFYERKLFDRWLEAIMPSDTNNLRYAKGTNTRYLSNIKIVQYDDFIKQIYAVELIDAFPISIAAQPLNWSDDGFHRVSVQFSYQRYNVIYDGKYDVVAAAAALLGNSAGQKLVAPINGAIERIVNRIF